jgi:cell division protein FtsX
MIAWYWLISAAWIGAMAALLLLGLCRISGQDKRPQ